MRKLKLPPNVLFHHDLHLFVFRPRRVLNQKVVDEIVTFLDQAEDRAEVPFNRYSDLSQLDSIELDFQYVCRVSLHRRFMYGKYPPVKSAFYVTTEQAAEIVTAHAVITDQSPLQVAMFRKVAEAAGWLEVSVTDLEIQQ